jgi:ribosomal-protein-alanine N-acetyltransferase
VPSDHKVRYADQNDLKSIFSIEKDVFNEEHWSIEMIENELNGMSGKITLVIERSKVILGYCMVRFFEKEVNIINMAIKPSYQGKGLGKLLLDYLLEHTPSKSSVFLEVKQGNFPAINLYLSFGFEEIGTRHSYYQDGSNALVMCLKN